MNRPDLRMDLNLFRVLDAIHTHGGISAAARALHLTQPAITHALNRLRELFGDPLFVRQGNRVIPTDKVRTIMADVQLHLKGLQDTVRLQAHFQPAELDLSFKVAFRDVLESIAFPPLLAQIQREAPHVRILSRRVASTELARELAAGTIDLAIDRRLAADARLRSQLLMHDTLVVVTRKDHPLTTAPLRKVDYFAAHHVAVSQLGDAIPLEVLFEQDGRPRHIALVCQHYFAACQVAAATDLLLTMPSSYAASFIDVLPISAQPLPMRLKPIPIFAYWHPSKDDDRAHQWFRQRVIETTGAAPAMQCLV